jgi:hypothetical protein
MADGNLSFQGALDGGRKSGRDKVPEHPLTCHGGLMILIAANTHI